MNLEVSQASLLEGENLEGGWVVREQVARSDKATGGHFSVGYYVESESGRRGFLKALDFSQALMASDPAGAFEHLSSAFNFEKSLLDKCKQRRLDHVVLAIGGGVIRKPNKLPVQYLIFELADTGDVRQYLDKLGADADWAWMMRSAHHIAVGLRQLHSLPAAHQDLKPSNVLVFEGDSSKIADLGCAATEGYDCPRDSLEVAGDKTYAPPELLYGHTSTDWFARRVGCDVFHLGSMLYFFATGVAVTPALRTQLPPEARPGAWGGTYMEVLPFVNEAFSQVLEDLDGLFPDGMQDEMVQLIKELCHPDVERRGDLSRGNRIRDRLSLERYVSRLDLLASRCEVQLGRRG